MEAPVLFVLVPVVIVVLYFLNCIKILREYERGVIFSLGRLQQDAKGPGLILVFPPIQKMVRIDLRQQALEVPPQDIITRDNVTLKVNADLLARGQRSAGGGPGTELLLADTAICPDHAAVGPGRSRVGRTAGPP